jgi:2'-5' RNA ligase
VDNDTTESLRLFYALWPDDATRAALTSLQTTLQGRKTQYGNLHVTLAFLGRQPAALVPALQAIMTRLPKSDMTIVMDRIGYFTRHRIVWAGMHQIPDTLSTLQRELTQALQQLNIVFDDQPAFKPHITLARDAQPPPDIPFEPIKWKANQIALVQSVIRPSGVTYQVLASHQLNDGF